MSAAAANTRRHSECVCGHLDIIEATEAARIACALDKIQWMCTRLYQRVYMTQVCLRYVCICFAVKQISVFHTCSNLHTHTHSTVTRDLGGGDQTLICTLTVMKRLRTCG